MPLEKVDVNTNFIIHYRNIYIFAITMCGHIWLNMESVLFYCIIFKIDWLYTLYSVIPNWFLFERCIFPCNVAVFCEAVRYKIQNSDRYHTSRPQFYVFVCYLGLKQWPLSASSTTYNLPVECWTLSRFLLTENKKVLIIKIIITIIWEGSQRGYITVKGTNNTSSAFWNST